MYIYIYIYIYIVAPSRGLSARSRLNIHASAWDDTKYSRDMENHQNAPSSRRQTLDLTMTVGK